MLQKYYKIINNMLRVRGYPVKSRKLGIFLCIFLGHGEGAADGKRA